jgi:hypothetical protein
VNHSCVCVCVCACVCVCVCVYWRQSFSEALAIRRKKLGNDHLDVASVLKDLALEHWNCDMFDDAMR